MAAPITTLRIVKLISGEEIIGVTTVFTETLHIKEADRIVSGFDPVKGLQVMLMDYTPFSDDKDELILDLKHVMFYTFPNDSMKAEYLRVHSTLAMPQKPKIIL